jgi:Flp pilus assembly protein TadD
VLAALGRSEEALEHLEAAERLGDRSPELLVARAKVLVRMGRVDDGRRVLEEAETLYPDHREISELLGILRAGA